jgi:hypothetical protein
MLPVTEIVEERSAHLSSLIPDGFYFPVALTPGPSSHSGQRMPDSEHINR